MAGAEVLTSGGAHDAPAIEIRDLRKVYGGKAAVDGLPPNDYPVYAPPLIVEVLSPSNTAAKLNRQRVVALSAGAHEFWIVDPERRTVEITGLDGVRVYGVGETVEVVLLGGAIEVEGIFA